MANYVKIYCKTSKKKVRDGTAPIVYLIVLGQKVSSINSGKYLLPKLFDNKAQLVKPAAGNSKLLNTHFKIEKEKLEAIILDFETRGQEINFDKIKNAYKIKEPTSGDAENSFISYCEKQMRFISKNRNQHEQSLRNLKKYAPNLTFQELNLNWLESYRIHFIAKGRKVNGFAHDFRSIRFFST
jgi:hypothetical protein